MKSTNCYPPTTIRYIQIAYLIGAILWILLFFWISNPCFDFWSWLFLFIPLLVFGIDFWNVAHIPTTIDSEMFQGNYITYGLLIVTIIINWNSDLSPGHKLVFIQLVFLAFVLIMFSLIDLWIGYPHLALHKHVRSILQTMALTILALSLYLYYLFFSSFYC